ncbi:MAG: monogalactosyldiacylglycerol synthase [Moraxellaceae bacterium]|jgi:hypothetical protein|nr:monogalactosyldiacylglycerol synthase [Moraxellaceae bacterium]
MSVQLFNKAGGATIGVVSDEEFQSLADLLEEESTTDSDYFIDQNVVDDLEAAGAPASLVSLLRTAVGDTDGIDVGWRAA